MTRYFVNESFILLYGKFQTDFVIEISNVSNTKMTVDLVNEYFIPICGKCQTEIYKKCIRISLLNFLTPVKNKERK